MKSRRHFLLWGGSSVAALAALATSSRWNTLSNAPISAAAAAETAGFPLVRTEAQWRQRLNPDQYAVLRESGTERPYTSPLNNEHREGLFACAGCDLDAFSSKTKFDSHTGWPSFWAPLDHAVSQSQDNSFGWNRTEVHCVRCGSHLGHVFEDGPRPTGLRYCMNGVAMTFRPAAV